MTKFRKRALLSSVAMLLVAMLALGTATFAWFNATTYAKASGVSMTTSTSMGLVARTASEVTAGANSSYSHNAILRYVADTDTTDSETTPGTNPEDFALSPVSLDITAAAPAFYEASSDGENDYQASSAGYSSRNDGFYDEIIWLKTTGAVAAQGTMTAEEYAAYLASANMDTVKQMSVKINLSDASYNLAKGIKVAAYSVVGTTVTYLGTWAPAVAQDNKFVDNAAQSTDNIGVLASEGVLDLVTANKTISVSSAGEKNGVRIYAYLDGENSNVKSSNVENLKEIVSSIEVNFDTQAYTAP